MDLSQEFSVDELKSAVATELERRFTAAQSHTNDLDGLTVSVPSPLDKYFAHNVLRQFAAIKGSSLSLLQGAGVDVLEALGVCIKNEQYCDTIGLVDLVIEIATAKEQAINADALEEIVVDHWRGAKCTLLSIDDLSAYRKCKRQVGRGQHGKRIVEKAGSDPQPVAERKATAAANNTGCDPLEVAAMAERMATAATNDTLSAIAVALNSATIFLNTFSDKVDDLHFVDQVNGDIMKLAAACKRFQQVVNEKLFASDMADKEPREPLSNLSTSTAGQISAALARSLHTLAEDVEGPGEELALSLAAVAEQSRVLDLSLLLSGKVDLAKTFEHIATAATTGAKVVEFPSALKSSSSSSSTSVPDSSPHAISQKRTRLQANKFVNSLKSAIIQAAIIKTSEEQVAGSSNWSKGKSTTNVRNISIAHEPALSLDHHSRFLGILGDKLVINDRKNRDWSALEKQLRTEGVPVKYVKQKAKRVLQERRARSHMRFWAKVKEIQNPAFVKAMIIDQVGTVVRVPDGFFDEIANYFIEQARAGKRQPGNILDWSSAPRDMMIKFLLMLHNDTYKGKPFSHVHSHFRDIFSLADIEMAILKFCNCKSCVEGWSVNDSTRKDEPTLRWHWSRKKADLLKAILDVHKSCASEDHFYAQCLEKIPRVKNYSKSDLEILLRAAHPVEECTLCTKAREALQAKPIHEVLNASPSPSLTIVGAPSGDKSIANVPAPSLPLALEEDQGGTENGSPPVNKRSKRK